MRRTQARAATRDESGTETLELNRFSIEHSPDAIFWVDREGRVIYANLASLQVLGYSPGEIISLTVFDLDPNFRRESWAGRWEEVKKTGSVLVESDFRTKQGARVPIEVHVNHVDTGGKEYHVCFVRNIAERQQTRRALAEQARLALLRAEAAAVFAERLSLGDMLRRCCEAIVKHLNAAFARIWLLDHTGRVLELKASAGMYTHLDGGHARVEVGKYKIGLIAEERTPHLTNSVVGDPRVHNQEWAKKEGMVSFAGYPLILEGQLLGVLATFARHPLSNGEFEALGSVANGIAQGADRKRAEEQIKVQQDEIRELSTPVLQLREGLLILPIVGFVDSHRARQVMEQVLKHVRRSRARVVVIDVTGVATIETEFASHLAQTAGASRLLGAEVILTGVSLRIAQSLVELGVDLSKLRTLGDLQSGVEEAMRLADQRRAPAGDVA